MSDYPTDDMVDAALDAFYPGENWRDVLSAYTAQCRSEMRLALIAADQAAWMPICEAPTDGKAVLCWPDAKYSNFQGHSENETVIGFFSDDEWWAETSPVCRVFEPTHFRPLPLPPLTPAESAPKARFVAAGVPASPADVLPSGDAG